MEANTTTTIVPAGAPTVATKNHTYTQHHLHSENHNNHHGHFPSKTILITITAATVVTVLFTIFLVVFLLRRQKSSSRNGTCKDNSRVLHDTSSRLIASTTLNFNSSPGKTSSTCKYICNSFLIGLAVTTYMQSYIIWFFTCELTPYADHHMNFLSLVRIS